MAPDLTQEVFGVAWNIPPAPFLIPEGFPVQSDLSGLEEAGQEMEGQGSSGSMPGTNSRWRISVSFLWRQAELSLR